MMKSRKKNDLGERIRRERKRLRMNQHDVAAAIGVDFTTVSRWERGVHTPSGEQNILLRELFGVDVFDAGAPPPSPTVASLAASIQELTREIGERDAQIRELKTQNAVLQKTIENLREAPSPIPPDIAEVLADPAKADKVAEVRAVLGLKQAPGDDSAAPAPPKAK